MKITSLTKRHSGHRRVSSYEWLFRAFALSPLIQQRVYVGHAAYLQSLGYPGHAHKRLLSQPHRNLYLLQITFGSLPPTRPLSTVVGAIPPPPPAQPSLPDSPAAPRRSVPGPAARSSAPAVV